jgi:FAD/FMN-containing dehydrogenase/Fe-S oxidoreductase
MDIEQLRLAADLRGLVQGDVLCSPIHRQLYASDASIYQTMPLAVVRPRTVNDCVSCVQYAAEHNLSIHPRGAGSGLAGESLGNGIVLDFSRYFRRWSFADGGRVRVQPGLVLAQLNRELQPHGRFFGPDPATRSVTTMGSVLALDASGSHWPIYGAASRTVVSVQVVSAEGKVLELGTHQPDEAGPAGRLAAGVVEIGTRYRDLIKPNPDQPLAHRAAYALADALRGDGVRLGRLMVGSEGTLGLITSATLETDPIPQHRGVMLLFFNRLEHATRGAAVAAQAQAAACDLIDRRLLEIAREADHRYEQLVPRDAEAMLLVEMQHQTLPQLRQAIQDLAIRVQDEMQLATECRWTTDPRERDFYWRLSRRVIPRLFRLKGETRPLPFIEDIVVAPQHLGPFLSDVQNVLKSQQVTATLFAHASRGQVHLRPFLDLQEPSDRARLRVLADAIYQSVMHYGGSICGEHGAGMSRSWFLPTQFGPLWPAMVEIKRLFDPANLFNPNKIVGPLPNAVDQRLRPYATSVELLPVGASLTEANGSTATNADDVDSDGERPIAVADEPTASVPLPVLHLTQHWDDDGGVARVARSCNGCGRCRTQTPEQRMCPMFRVTPAEEASPRAKANLFRALLSGELNTSELATEELRSITELCFNCHQCRLECPAAVDIPKLVTEMKGQYVATNGLRMSDWYLTRLDLVAKLVGRFQWLSNTLMQNPRIRWVLDRTLGLSRFRKLQPFARRNFFRWAAKRKMHRPSKQAVRKVLYFVDYFATWHDVELAQAFVAIMKQNGIEVYVPTDQGPSWMAKIAVGDLEPARRGAARNVKRLVEAVRQGYEIVCTEPSAALCLKHEYPNLLGSEESQLVAQHTHEACRYLWDLHQQGMLQKNFRQLDVSVAYHQPCHIRAIDEGRPSTQLLALIPGVTVEPIEAGCSGMAGLYGLHRDHYRTSLRIGWPMITAMRRSTATFGASECTACRMQMEHGSDKPTIHPLKLLAAAYGHPIEGVATG